MAISKPATCRDGSALFTWLRTSCRHESSAFRRRNRSIARRVELIEDRPDVRAAVGTLPASFHGAPDDPFHRLALGHLVPVALDRFPPRHGETLERRCVEGLPVKENAARLGPSPKAAEPLLVRARAASRDGYAALVQGAVFGRPPTRIPESPS